MSNSHVVTIGPVSVLVKAVSGTIVIGGLLPAWFLFWLNYQFQLNAFGAGIVACIVLTVCCATVWKLGWHAMPETGFYMVRRFIGNPTSDVYGSIETWGIPGLEDFVCVNGHEEKVDPDKFPILVDGDKIEVTVDGYFTRAIIDPALHLQVHGSDAILTKAFIGTSRAFIAPWLKASYMTNKQDLLAEYLQLPPKPDHGHHVPIEHVHFRDKLLKLVQPNSKGESYLSADCVDAIMDYAGNFKGEAARFGIGINDIVIERIDLPESITGEAAKAAAEASNMARVAIKNKQRMEMAQGYRDADPNLSMKDALDRADRLMPDVNVDTQIHDINIHGGDGFAQAGAAFLSALGGTKKKPTQKKGGTK